MAKPTLLLKCVIVNDNPVKGVVVNFELENPLGGTLNTSQVLPPMIKVKLRLLLRLVLMIRVQKKCK
jgi:hypothetical protein